MSPLFRLGAINYLNLLPFYLFLKRRGMLQKMVIKWGYPAQINRWLEEGRIDGAFISSVRSIGKKCLPVGIGSRGAVWSVILCPGGDRNDRESNTSNLLKIALDEVGEVIIGDKGLKRYFQPENECRDLGELWFQKYGLPFLFARFCCRRRCAQFEKVLKEFVKRPVKIPQYILKLEAEKRGLSPQLVKEYLQLIHFPIGWREERGFKLFIKLLQKRGVKIEKRWEKW